MAYLQLITVYLKACRFESWVTWVFSFVLGSIFFTIPLLSRFISFMLAFLFATASIFVLNQYFDYEADRKNNVKAELPVASNSISRPNTLFFSLVLSISCLILVSLTDIKMLPFFVLYLGLWTAYSAPVPNLKRVPVLDFLTSGVGAGLIPFYIGLGAADRTAVGVFYVVLMTIPLVMFHSGAHIVQTVGDFEPDRDVGIETFAVRFGQRKSVFVAGLLVLLAFVVPFVYLFLGFVQPTSFLLAAVLIPPLVPIVLRFRSLYKDPSQSAVVALNKTARNVGILVPIMILSYIIAVNLV
jgi:4-hydroxybenzoate polyprenyltransferase